MTGIVSYGVYIPTLRIKLSEISQMWDKEGSDIEKGLGLSEKVVANLDEDAVTLAVEAGFRALKTGNIAEPKIQAITVGSESHPYAVKPTSTIVGEILGIPNNYLAADLEFACKAGSAGMQFLAGLVESNHIENGLVIGSDVAQAKPGDVLEYTAASTATAFILGKDKIIAKLIDFISYSSNTPDFWRRDGQKYPSHGGRFTGEPAYFTHVLSASKNLLKKLDMKPSDFDYAVFHMPNGKFPAEAAKRLGFTTEQIQPGFIVTKIGNPYSASSLTGLAATLDVAKPNKKIFMCSYGSGAGSDAFVFETTKEITKFQERNKYKVEDQINKKQYVNYSKIIKTAIAKGYL